VQSAWAPFWEAGGWPFLTIAGHQREADGYAVLLLKTTRRCEHLSFNDNNLSGTVNAGASAQV
jgi:hypothetical protein